MGDLLLDTHALIWLAYDQLGDQALGEIDAARCGGGVLVSTVSAWEIGLLSRPRATGGPRYSFLPDPATWFARLIANTPVQLSPLTFTAAIASSHLPGTFHDDPADRMLVATAREMNCPLMTRDRKILDYGKAGHVRTIGC